MCQELEFLPACVTGLLTVCAGSDYNRFAYKHNSEVRWRIMARRKGSQRDWRVILFLALSLLIVLSMILAMILPGISLPG